MTCGSLNNEFEPTGSDGVASQDVSVTGSVFNSLLQTLSIPPAFTVLRVNDLHHCREDVQQNLQKCIDKQYEQKICPVPEIIPHPVLPDVLIIPSACRDSSEVAPVDKEVIVDLLCGMAVLRGAEIFAPGVMAAPVAMNRGDKVAVYSDVKGLCRRGLTTRFDGDRMFLGNGTAVMSRHDIFVATATPSGTAVVMTEPVFDCPSLNGVLPGQIFLQNLPSIVAGHVLSPRPGEAVLDMCAAPGGKTTHIATLMKDEGTVVALDKASAKISKIKENASSLGLTCIKAFCFDGRKAANASTNSVVPTAVEDIWQPPFAPMTFDRILLDAPCSGLGQRPQVYNKMSLKELKSYPSYQRQLFSTAVQLLKDEGTLVYSTCTITLEENEGLVAWALKNHPEMRLVLQEPHIGGHGLPIADLSQDDRHKVQRFWPSSSMTETCVDSVSCDNDTIGFFIAKFIKSSGR
ncbi:tRNA (cytosine(72)-C(5))-methyltransferase NSUN6-like [Diadema antillarum]|uniref:tRNA (cytosine(72)-C(5))-methyltransferase NSUN6-like n=2 Tax=Diadema antillarum TaxID=105358 RepID=UPI003A86FE64